MVEKLGDNEMLLGTEHVISRRKSSLLLHDSIRRDGVDHGDSGEADARRHESKRRMYPIDGREHAEDLEQDEAERVYEAEYPEDHNDCFHAIPLESETIAQGPIAVNGVWQ